ncbi:hypothetical protein NHQ30_002271 [Ciborinia camelliae]|nr:hypothetical protein NHQ30_002271 [Ciborinia camelliae]
MANPNAPRASGLGSSEAITDSSRPIARVQNTGIPASDQSFGHSRTSSTSESGIIIPPEPIILARPINWNVTYSRPVLPSSSQSLALLDCPVEILQIVFGFLSPKDFHSLSHVCKGLHEHVEPWLYSEIQWTWIDSQTPPIILLIRSIMARPKLAIHIQSLILNGNKFQSRSYPPSYTEYPPPKILVAEIDLQEPIAFIEKLYVHYGDLWIHELRNGTMEAFVAVLLSQLSSLKCLRMGPNFAAESRIVGMVLQSALCESVGRGLPRFQQLQDVSFDLHPETRGDDTFTENTSDVLPFLSLPNIKHLSASIDSPLIFMWPGLLSPVTYLTRSNLDKGKSSGSNSLCYTWTQNFALGMK